MARPLRQTTEGTPAIPWWPHPGRLSYRRAVAIQRQLAGRVITKNDARRIRYVAGLDAAFSSDGKDCLAAAVLWDLRAGAVCAQSLAVRRVQMPCSVLRTREGTRPVYVSVGHRVSLARARALVMKCLGQYRFAGADAAGRRAGGLRETRVAMSAGDLGPSA